MDDDELEVSYPGKHVSTENMRNLVPLMDLFCLSEVKLYSHIKTSRFCCLKSLRTNVRRVQVCLLADIIQHFVDQKLDFDCAYVYEDVQKCIEFIHRSGNLHREILSDPAKYLQKNVSLTIKLVLMPPTELS